MKRILQTLLVGSMLLIVGCSDPVSNGRSVTLIQEWFANANFAGELLGAQQFASKNGLSIIVQEGSYDIDPIKLVLAGQADFGVAGADKVLAANDKGADLVIVGVINQESPTCFLTLKKSGITTPQAFKGHKVGVLTGTATEYVYRLMMKRSGLDPSEYEEVEAPFDLNTFLLGVYDVRPAFIYDEPVSLDLQHVDYNLIDPRDHGISLLGTVYFTKRSTLEADPDLVKDFVYSVAEGWERVMEKPSDGIEALVAFAPKVDRSRELASLNKGLELFGGAGGQVLLADDAHIQGTAEALIELGVIKENFDIHIFRLDFAKSYHAQSH